MNKEEDSTARILLIAAFLGMMNRPAGEQSVYTADGITFRMRYLPPKSFPTGVDDNGDIDDDAVQDVPPTANVGVGYWMAETETTYELWQAVYLWATTDAGGGVRADGGPLYTFANPGHQGGDPGGCGGLAVGTNQHPVSCINWRDAMVWTNALTEWYNSKTGSSLGPVYFSDAAFTTLQRDSSDGTCGGGVGTTPGDCDNPYVNAGAKGFRLPTSNEWELSARYIHDLNGDGDIQDAGESYPGNYASGATADNTDATATGDVAWYNVNASNTTNEVATRNSNALGFYDLSGNIFEWNYDWHPLYPGSDRVSRGGSYNNPNTYLQVGYQDYIAPYSEYTNIGLRIARRE